MKLLLGLLPIVLAAGVAVAGMGGLQPKQPPKGGTGGCKGRCAVVPEIDPSTGLAALTGVLAGLVLVFERRRSA